MSDTFKILRKRYADPQRAVPWAMVAPHARQAMLNHYQTLERLNERGGLGASEMVAVLEDRDWKSMPDAEAEARLAELLVQFEARA